MSNVDFAHIRINGVTLNVAQAGPVDGPLVLLLHGFPEFWYGWRQQIDFLAQAGFRVWAPDQRGYNLSDKPRHLSAYNLHTLTADIVGLIEAANHETAIIVGHDWGGVVAWWLAIHHPQRVERLVILNAPHPAAMQRHLRRSPRQMVRSLYAAFFQLPRLPEWLLLRGQCSGGRSLLRASSHPGAFSDADLERYCQAWQQPGAMTAMLNWYRALVQRKPRITDNQRVHVSTLIIWGAQDVALSRELAGMSAAYCDHAEVVMIEQASHWVQHEASDRVNSLIASVAQT